MDENDEGYNAWKQNTSFLYDLFLNHTLIWPSLTCQWLPYREENNEIIQYKGIIGTHTSDQDSEYVMIINVEVCSTKRTSKKNSSPFPSISIEKRIAHSGEVTRARYMHQNENIVATKASLGVVDIFDFSGEGKKVKTLKGHTEDGYGVAWSYNDLGRVASCGEDKCVFVWDIEQSTDPILSWEKGFEETVEDVAWSKKRDNVICCVGDDKSIWILDTKTEKKQMFLKDAHDGDIYSVDFHPYTDHLFITGGGDGSVKLWDLKKMDSPLCILESHEDEVYTVQWSPQNETLLASSGNDGLFIWDMSQIGVDQCQEEALDGPPELLFVHSGHKAKINDFCWNPKEDFLFMSTDEVNTLQVWSMLDEIYYDNQEEVDDEDLE